MQGATFGFSDEIAGGLRGAGEAIGAFARGDDVGAAYTRGYSAEADYQRALVDQYRRDAPVSSFANSFLPSLATGSGATGLLAKTFARVLPQAARVPAAIYGGAAAQGALYGAGSGVTPEERAQGAAFGAAVAPAFALGGQLAGKAVGVGLEAGRNLATRFAFTPEQRAVRIINRSMQQEGLSPDDLRRRALALARPRQTNGQRVPAGPTAEQNFELIGPSGRSMAAAVANVPGPGKSIAAEALERRATGGVVSEDIFAGGPRKAPKPSKEGSVSSRTLQAAAEATKVRNGVPANYDEYLDALIQGRRGTAATQYREAYQQAVPEEAEPLLLELMTKGQFSGRALDDAVTAIRTDMDGLQGQIAAARISGQADDVSALADDFARAERVLVSLERIKAGNPEAGDVTPHVLDLYQRGLWSLVDSFGGPSTQAGRAFSNARNGFLAASDQAVPKLGETRQLYGKSMRLQELMERSRAALNSPENLERMTATIRGRNLNADEMDAVAVGILDALQTKIAAGDTRFVAQFMRRQDWQNMLQSTLSPQAYAGLRRRILRELSMQANRSYIMSGSRTTPLAEDIRAMTNGEDELSFIADVINSGGDVKSPILRRLAAAWTNLNQPGVRDERVNRAMADRLFRTASAANAKALADEISSLPSAATMQLDSASMGGIGGVIGGSAGTIDAQRRRRDAVR